MNPPAPTDPNTPIDILIVDDREENLLALEAVLSSPGYRLVRAASGFEAIERARETEFAVILLDVQMPGMDGFETASRLRREAKRRETPIIFLTAINRDESHIHSGYDLGAVDYLFKPFDIVALRSKVAVFAELFRKDRTIRRQERLLAIAYERSHTRFRAFFDQASLPMVIYALDGTCIDVNQAWELLFGTSRDELDGYNILTDTRLEAKELKPHLDRAWAGEAVKLPPFRYDPAETGKSGRPRWIVMFAYPVKDSAGAAREIALIIRDVTEETEARQALEESESRYRALADSLELAIHARDEFLSIASHELRTPVTSMALTTQMLQRQVARDGAGVLTEERMLKLIDQSGRQLTRLSRLIDDMLDISRINTGRFTIRRETVDLGEVVRESVERISPQLMSAKYPYDLEVAPGLIVEADRYRLEQAIGNLLTNAMRYGQEKPLRIALRKDGPMARISVIDQGIGIADADKKRIFERFERAISFNEVSGLGLGLYIVRQIVEAHHGRIELDSAPGRGATFSLLLPLTDMP